LNKIGIQFCSSTHQPMSSAAAAGLPLDLGDLFPFFQGEFNPAFSTNEISHLFNTHFIGWPIVLGGAWLSISVKGYADALSEH
jgi:hypothetical protein